MYKEPAFDLDIYYSWLKKLEAEREKLEAEREKKWKSHFFTFSREYGCDCYATAIELCRLINEKQGESPWHIFSHPIMEKLVSDEKLGAEMIKSVSEKHYNFINWFMDGLVPDYLQSPQSQAFKRMQTLILNLAEKGNCIMIGGGAQIITHDLDQAKFVATHIRLVAPHQFRVKQVMKRHGISRGDAEVMVEKMQHARDKFIEKFTGMKATDESLYHLTFNNEYNSPQEMAKTILSYTEIRGII